MDANWRWIHKTSGYENCYTGNQWDKSICEQDGTSKLHCGMNGAMYFVEMDQYGGKGKGSNQTGAKNGNMVL